MSTPAEQSTYMSNARGNTRQLWAALNNILAMQNEWNAENYGQTLADGIDANAGITGAMVGAVVFDTANAIHALLNAGGATNIANIL